MENSDIIQQFLDTSKAIKELLNKCEYLEEKTARQNAYINSLEDENRKLKYEYEDSKLKRDVPIPYKWKAKKGKTSMENQFYMFCPKCDCSITNWQNYCHMCGQKILKGNPQDDMGIPWEEQKSEGE